LSALAAHCGSGVMDDGRYRHRHHFLLVFSLFQDQQPGPWPSELTKRAVESAIRADSKENGATWEANAALQQAAYGKTAESRQSAAKALRLAPASQGVQAEAALAFAMAGDTARAESLAQDLGKSFPLDTQMQSLWLPAIRTQLALNRKEPRIPLNAQSTPPIELGLIQFVANISCLYPSMCVQKHTW
jgi:hypothetical protein